MGKCYFVVDVEGGARILSVENMKTSWRAWSEREGKSLCIPYYKLKLTLYHRFEDCRAGALVGGFGAGGKVGDFVFSILLVEANIILQIWGLLGLGEVLLYYDARGTAV